MLKFSNNHHTWNHQLWSGQMMRQHYRTTSFWTWTKSSELGEGSVFHWLYIWLVILRLASWLGFHVRCLIKAAIASQISLAYLHSSKGKWGFSSHFFLHGFHEVSEIRFLKPTHLVGSIHRTNYTLMGSVLNGENFTIYWDVWSYHVGKITILKPKLD